MTDIKYGRKASGIKRELQHKIEDWLKSIEDPSVAALAKRDTIVTGGSIASMLMGDKVNDYDIYFKTKSTTLAVANYYADEFKKKWDKTKTINRYSPIIKEETIENCLGEDEDRVVVWLQSAGVASEGQEDYKYFENMPKEESRKFFKSMAKIAKKKGKKYRPIFLSQNAITLSDKMQIVIRFYGEPEEIHRNYDFVHAKCYYSHYENHLELNKEAMQAMMSHTLIYEGSLYPIASIFRMKKFLERGWRITAGQQLKIMWQISELDLKDMQLIREQLTGVDLAYMWELLAALRDVDPEKINSAYVARIIDRIFD